MTQVKEDIEQLLDTVWKDHSERIQKTNIGTFLDVDNLTIRNAGLSEGDMRSPGPFSTWKNEPRGSRYFLQSFGPGRTRMFKK